MSTESFTDGQAVPQRDQSRVADLLGVVESVARTVPAVQHAINHLDQAASAARENDDQEVVRLLQSGFAQPLTASLENHLPGVIRGAIVQSLGSQLPALLSQAVREKINEELIQLIVGQVLDEHLRRFDDNQRAIGELKKNVADLTQMQERVLRNAEDGAVSLVAGPGTFLNRYYERYEEKAELGRHVAKLFFQQPLRCFVMASSTSVHLGQQLRRAQIAPGCFFQTNSTMFPPALLGESAQHEVWTFCGPTYDHDCAGWLPNIADVQTYDALRYLFIPFQQGGWELSTAFLIPRKLSVVSGMYFVRPETARIARVLTEFASHVVVMVTADRLCQQLEEDELAVHFPQDGQWSNVGETATLVVSGQRPQKDLQELANEFASRGMRVHFQEPPNGVWREV